MENKCIFCGALIPDGRHTCLHCMQNGRVKTNRDFLREYSDYELLCDINDNFITGNPHCVLEAIEGKQLMCRDESCAKCIAMWLNEKRSES